MSVTNHNHKDIELLQIAGRGANVGPDGTIVVEAGWDCEALIEGAVMLKVRNAIKNPRLQAEFRAYSETRWESTNKLATQYESSEYKVQRLGKAFGQQVQVVYESKSPLTPSPNGTPINFPFKFLLPKKSMPASFHSVCGSIDYYVKVVLIFQETGKISLLKQSMECLVPVTVFVPERAKLKLLKMPSQFHHSSPKSDDKVQYTIGFPRKILCIGETVQIDLDIHATPGDTTLRSVHVSMRPVVAYLNNLNIAHRASFPRPLSEATRSFNFVAVKPEDPISMSIDLLIDPELAQSTFESDLIRVQTLVKLHIVTSDSEIPNISQEFPLIILPPLKESLPVTPASVDAPYTPPASPPTARRDSTESRMSHIPSILGRSSSRDTFTPQREASILLSVLQFAPGPEKGIPAGAFAQTDVPAFVMSPVPVPGQMAGSGAPEKILQVFQNLSAAPLPPVYTDLDAKKLAIRDEKMAYRNEKEGYKEVNAGLAAMQVSEKSGGSRVPLSEWNIDHVTEWILAIPSLDSAEEVARLFKAQEIDGSVLLELSEDDLKNEIGITHLARRRKVIGAIQRLKNGEL